MRHLDLFSGIGGFALAAQTVYGKNYENIGFCDNDRFCQQVLKKHWPNAKIYDDIKTLTYAGSAQSGGLPDDEREEIPKTRRGCDLITGGFPCQPFSQAGRRKGTADDRHLWPEMLRVIREFKPTWVVAENVRGLTTWGGGVVFEQVCADLEAEKYDVQAFIIPAVGLDAPHRRERVWFVAHAVHSGPWEQDARGITTKSRLPSEYRQSDNTAGQLGGTNNNWGDERSARDWKSDWPEVAAELCRVDDGVPAGMDGLKLTGPGHRAARLKALGNAIVPQVAMQLFTAMKALC